MSTTESNNDTNLETIINPETPASAGFFSEMLGCCGSTERAKGDTNIMKEKGEETYDSGISSQAKDIFALLDEDQSGEVEKSEFKTRLRESEELSKVFFKYSGLKDSAPTML